MAFEFKKLAALMGLASESSEVTPAHLKAAEDKIEALERDKTGAEEQASKALADLKTVQADLKTAQADLTKAKDKVATLEQWKKEQKATDGREEDASNDLDDEDDAPAAGANSFEAVASRTIAATKQRLGVEQK